MPSEALPERPGEADCPVRWIQYNYAPLTTMDFLDLSLYFSVKNISVLFEDSKMQVWYQVQIQPP